MPADLRNGLNYFENRAGSTQIKKNNPVINALIEPYDPYSYPDMVAEVYLSPYFLDVMGGISVSTPITQRPDASDILWQLFSERIFQIDGFIKTARKPRAFKPGDEWPPGAEPTKLA
jgi:hypothetical protein